MSDAIVSVLTPSIPSRAELLEECRMSVSAQTFPLAEHLVMVDVEGRGCAWTMNQGEHSYLLQNTGQALGLALIFAAIVLPAAEGASPSGAVRFLETPVLVATGVVSYSIFLWHLPVIVWLNDHGLTFGGWGGLLVNALIVAVVVGALSALTYRFVERPALSYKRSMRVRQPAPTAADAQPAAPGPATEPAI